MEIDGKVFYLKASRESGNELGKKLLASLAVQEDYHRQKFEQIYENIRKSRNWPVVDFKPDGGKTLRTIFAVETNKPAPNIKVAQTELDAVLKAMQMEDKSYDFYHDRFEQAGAGCRTRTTMKPLPLKRESTNWCSSITSSFSRTRPAGM